MAPRHGESSLSLRRGQSIGQPVDLRFPSVANIPAEQRTTPAATGDAATGRPWTNPSRVLPILSTAGRMPGPFVMLLVKRFRRLPRGLTRPDARTHRARRWVPSSPFREVQFARGVESDVDAASGCPRRRRTLNRRLVEGVEARDLGGAPIGLDVPATASSLAGVRPATWTWASSRVNARAAAPAREPVVVCGGRAD